MHSDPDAQQGRALRLGVAGAVLAFLALAGVQAAAIRPYLPPDELYHVGYAATLLDGRLPTLTTPLPGHRVPLMPDDDRARRVLAAAGAGALVGGIACGSAIWFYLRNRGLYGSLTGAAYNQRLFGFEPQDHVLDLLLSPAYALRLYDGLWVWTRFSLPRVPTLPALVAVPRVVGALGLDRRPGARRGLWIIGVSLAQLAPPAAAWAGFLTALDGRRPRSPSDMLGGVAGLLDAAGVPWPWLPLALAGALLTTALVLLVMAVVQVDPRDRRRPSPDGPGRGWDGREEEARAELAPGHRTPAP